MKRGISEDYLADEIRDIFEPLHLQEDSPALRKHVMTEAYKVLFKLKDAGHIEPGFGVSCDEYNNPHDQEPGKLTITIAFKNRNGTHFEGDFTGTIAKTTYPEYVIATTNSDPAFILGPQPTSNLSDFIFQATDDTGRTVRMKLDPEPNITTYELTKITMMLFSVSSRPYNVFDAFQFVKKNNLERHFTILA